MRGYLAVVAVTAAAACGSVAKKDKQDAAVQIDSPSIDSAMTDAAADAGMICMTDSFDGALLDAHWTVTAGTAPTYAVAGSKISITDAPIASTPSNNTESWINDTDTDKGNQIGWAQSIGTGDFIVRSHLDWASSNADLMISGIAVTDSTARIVALAGAYDGMQGTLGGDYALIGVAGGSDLAQQGALIDPGAVDVRIERTAGMLHVFIANTEKLTAADTSAITHVSIEAIPYRLNGTTYSYGTAEFTSVEVCH